MTKTSTVSVERLIEAPAEEIFGLLSDAGMHRTFDGSGTLRGVRGPSEPLVLGSVFGMSMKMGVSYSTRNTVIEYEKDRRIAWRTTVAKYFGGRVWRYELEPRDGGTLVRETWDITGERFGSLMARTKLSAKTEGDMTRTLERIAEAVER